MVMRQVTQHDPESHGDSVRITAEIRRRVLLEHYTEKLERQQSVVELERNARNNKKSSPLMYTQDDLRVSNTIAVLQDASSYVQAYGGNRDFHEVQR